jgi:hypothetical protein
MVTTLAREKTVCPDCGKGPYVAYYMKGIHKMNCKPDDTRSRKNVKPRRLAEVFGVEVNTITIVDTSHHLHITGGSVDNKNVQFVEQCCHCGEQRKVPYSASSEVEQDCGKGLANRTFVRQDPWGDGECSARDKSILPGGS